MFNREVARALLDQEIDRLDSKIKHYAGRIERGTADLEDETAAFLYSEIRNDLFDKRPKTTIMVVEIKWIS